MEYYTDKHGNEYLIMRYIHGLGPIKEHEHPVVIPLNNINNTDNDKDNM